MSIISQKIILLSLLALNCGSFATAENTILEYARITACFSCIAGLWFFILKTEASLKKVSSDSRTEGLDNFGQFAHDLRSPLSGLAAVAFTLKEKDPEAAEILSLAQSRIEKLLKTFDEESRRSKR